MVQILKCMGEMISLNDKHQQFDLDLLDFRSGTSTSGTGGASHVVLDPVQKMAHTGSTNRSGLQEYFIIVTMVVMVI